MKIMYKDSLRKNALISRKRPHRVLFIALEIYDLITTMTDKFSFLKEGLPSLKTACAPCMLGTPPNLGFFTLYLNHAIDEYQQ